jgi:hypothetical protein
MKDLSDKPLAVIYTGCFECDFEAEFHGKLDDDDTAYFPCPNCGQTFQMSDFSNQFNEEEEEENY